MLDLETAMNEHYRQIKRSKPNNGIDKDMQWVWWHVLYHFKLVFLFSRHQPKYDDWIYPFQVSLPEPFS
jgi:hypothetical protein